MPRKSRMQKNAARDPRTKAKGRRKGDVRMFGMVKSAELSAKTNHPNLDCFWMSRQTSPGLGGKDRMSKKRARYHTEKIMLREEIIILFSPAEYFLNNVKSHAGRGAQSAFKTMEAPLGGNLFMGLETLQKEKKGKNEPYSGTSCHVRTRACWGIAT